ncbi:hypothetical protein N5079_06140 [Planotetraspora sp. A-T 1434]|uniref:hypothetical protein n=1 Tax=Planotetraspora sp. A-T 1434 TaxID=2979219 RepID=UPI0021BF4A1D|nr:hypothetical protein [Planotetraspora sp. A-T 1434]MCT9929798.1 hypothetical protein [Planotetraspora sp. A-T 1434]
MAQPYRPFTPIPTVTPTTTTQEVTDWFYLRRAQVEALARSMTIKSDISPDVMEFLGRKLRTMEGRLTGGIPPATVVNDLQAWLGEGGDHGAWDFYVAAQTKQDQAELARQAEAARSLAVDQARNRASAAAIALTKTYGSGLLSDRGTGRVIAGLAVVNTPATFTGISGVDKHTHPSHPVIDELLKGTHKAEEWPQASCAEVDALKSYLHAAAPPITSIAQIPRGALVFHAQVWNIGGPRGGKSSTPHWQARGACANCSQWVEKIGALLA